MQGKYCLDAIMNRYKITIPPACSELVRAVSEANVARQRAIAISNLGKCDCIVCEQVATPTESSNAVTPTIVASGSAVRLKPIRRVR